MKFLTLNTHSWMEDEPLKKLEDLCAAITRHSFDVIALQEVNQLMTAPAVNQSLLTTFSAANNEHFIKEDNFAFLLQQKLREKGLEYYWTWEPSHIGYDRYDEGLAVLSLKPIQEVCSFFASENTAYDDYKSRKVLGIKSADHWFFNLHLGWWQDEHDPFSAQWKKCTALFDTLKEPIVLLGDFNNPAHIEQEGYALVTQSWFDTYTLAEQKDSGYTVAEAIDGWTENQSGLRIDYIFVDRSVKTSSSQVIFNGINEPVVSDHFGVAVEIAE
ncbi:endonuclease/exonuclease/phosphatase family protein [Desemzia sp. RIT804]|uniref:endonuclease/exonuclease/phosphatase family protein n=1 Tax=Desemzia sp. RIT 804 TaxID=2810209 RepID=UPI0019516914|nr:endonuclease/exonuclease/phosphatase family protein [Desemzia sp. RIT 804]MBM6615493.1 endonuclease/exonuclease/phosphatase family protein [Desemzia sp. RIT 804]